MVLNIYLGQKVLELPLMGEKPSKDFDREALIKDFENYYSQFKPIREVVCDKIPSGQRHALYIGMNIAWPDPLIIADADMVDAVDVAYYGFGPYSHLKERVERVEDSTEMVREMQAYLVDDKQVEDMIDGMGSCLNSDISRNVSSDRHTIIQTDWKDRTRTYRLIPRSIDSYIRRADTKYPFVITARTFLGASTWGEVIAKMPDRGLLYTSGVGYGRAYNPVETFSGSNIEESGIPLYFPPSAIGLREINTNGLVDEKLGGYPLYEKAEQESATNIRDTLMADSTLDYLIDVQTASQVVRRFLTDSSGNHIGTYYLPRESVAFLNSVSSLQLLISNSIVRAGVFDDSEVRITLQNMLDRIKLVKDGSINFIAQNKDVLEGRYRTVGYLPSGITIVAFAEQYYDRLQRACEYK